MKFAVAIVLSCVLAVAFAASKCEEQQRQAGGGGMVGAFIPNCEADGSYSARQCHGSTGMCWCARHDGSTITAPSRGRYDGCKCIREKDAVEQAKPQANGAFVPTCNGNGNYSPKQCLAGSCWCVDVNSGVKTNQKGCL